MDTVDTQCAVLVDLFDRVLDTGFLEVRFLLLQGIVERVLCRTGSGRSSTWRSDWLSSRRHYTAVSGQCHVNGSCLIQDRHDSYVNRHGNTCFVGSRPASI